MSEREDRDAPALLQRSMKCRKMRLYWLIEPEMPAPAPDQRMDSSFGRQALRRDRATSSRAGAERRGSIRRPRGAPTSRQVATVSSGRTSRFSASRAASISGRSSARSPCAAGSRGQEQVKRASTSICGCSGDGLGRLAFRLHRCSSGSPRPWAAPAAGTAARPATTSRHLQA